MICHAFTFLSFFAMIYKEQNRQVVFLKNNGLRPIIKILQRPSAYYFFLQPSGTREALLEQPQATGTTGTPAGLIAAIRVRVCDGNAMNVR